MNTRTRKKESVSHACDLGVSCYQAEAKVECLVFSNTLKDNVFIMLFTSLHTLTNVLLVISIPTTSLGAAIMSMLNSYSYTLFINSSNEDANTSTDMFNSINQAGAIHTIHKYWYL